MFTATQKEQTDKERMAEDLKNGTHRVKQDARLTGENVRENLETMAHEAGRRVRSMIDHAGDEVTDATSYVKSQIRSNPLQSGLIAVGAGFLLGLLFRR